MFLSVLPHNPYQKRCQILAFWKAGYTQTEIAREIGVNQSTISRELNRNITFVRTKLGCWQYKPDYAQFNARQRHAPLPATDPHHHARNTLLPPSQ